MATQTLALADAILKDLYVGPIVEQLNNKTYLLDQIERDTDHVDQRSAKSSRSTPHATRAGDLEPMAARCRPPASRRGRTRSSRSAITTPRSR